jgi:hypothetical protein
VPTALSEAAEAASERGQAAIYLLKEGRALAVFAVADAIREESREARGTRSTGGATCATCSRCSRSGSWSRTASASCSRGRSMRSRFRAPRSPLGFWFAQQGSIYVFVVLIFVYVVLMNRLDREFDVDEGGDA